MLGYCDVIVIFQIYGQFRAIQKHRISDEESAKLAFSLKVTFILQKLKTKLKNFWHSCHNIALSKGIIFAKKADFLQKMNTDISKIKRTLVLQSIFFETTCVCTCIINFKFLA